MGFLSYYSGTKRVDMGRGFWVDVKKFLTADDRAEIESLIIQARVRVQGDGKRARPTAETPSNMSIIQMETALRGVVGWNLTDEQDAPLPTHPREALRKVLAGFPPHILDKIADAVGSDRDELAEDDEEDPRATFPKSGEGVAAG